VIYKV